jgi:aryl-alcohol dehydrogenase-like predicted oxidoreductase
VFGVVHLGQYLGRSFNTFSAETAPQVDYGKSQRRREIMQRRKLPNAPFDVSLLSLGTMTWGEQNTEAEAHAQLDWAVAHGVDFVDTAEMYPVPPNGTTYSTTEKFIGTWIAKGNRNKITLASKVAGPGRDRPWIRNGDPSLTKKNIIWACEDSLKRLKTDVIDLFQIHWPDRNVAAFGAWQFDPTQERETVPLLEQVEAMAELIKAGKIRAWGVSNETSWGVTRLCAVAEANNLPKPASIQNAYHLLNRLFEGDLAEVSYREGVPLLAYSVLGMGMLTGKYRNGARPTDGRLTVYAGKFGLRYTRPTCYDAVDAYAELAKKHNMSLTALALAYVCRQPFMGSAILGATKIAQLDEQLAAYQTPLSDELIRELNTISLRFSHPAA